MKKATVLFVALLVALGCLSANAQENQVFYGDPLPDAPLLAARGAYGVGVQTLTLVNPDQIDLLNMSETNPDARYDRPLTVEVWYPAIIPDGEDASTTYETQLGRSDQSNVEAFTFAGRALRDAAPDNSDGAYPLLIVSHGYPGSRYQLTYLTENLASKGYVVAAIDHTDSTFADTGNFFSTLLNRALDQNFVLDEMATLGAGDGFLSGLVDADNTAIIGYSMGGYGALNAAGAGYNGLLESFLPVIAPRMAGNADYAASLDTRIKAIVVLAPWGGDLTAFGLAGMGFWDADAMGGITVPSLWIAGSLDDVAGYDAIVGLFDNAVNSDRALLTYENALHNVAGNPPPSSVRDFPDYERYSEPAWQVERINNINQHFITAFLEQTLMGTDQSAILQPLIENANDGVVSLDEAGAPTADHTYWSGFLPRTAAGMSLRYSAAQ
ncbi:MAG: dienelactone hydrolase [Chloroflexota bacterium]|nr:dienelactone hydrolase [Chloroflexota bacterium]